MPEDNERQSVQNDDILKSIQKWSIRFNIRYLLGTYDSPTDQPTDKKNRTWVTIIRVLLRIHLFDICIYIRVSIRAQNWSTNNYSHFRSECSKVVF